MLLSVQNLILTSVKEGKPTLNKRTVKGKDEHGVRVH